MNASAAIPSPSPPPTAEFECGRARRVSRTRAAGRPEMRELPAHRVSPRPARPPARVMAAPDRTPHPFHPPDVAVSDPSGTSGRRIGGHPTISRWTVREQPGSNGNLVRLVCSDTNRSPDRGSQCAPVGGYRRGVWMCSVVDGTVDRPPPCRARIDDRTVRRRRTRRPAVIEYDLHNGPVMAKIYRAGLPSLGQGQWGAAFVAGIVRGRTSRPRMLPRTVLRMARPILTQLATTLDDPTPGEVVSFPHAVRREHMLGSNRPVVPLGVAVVTGTRRHVRPGHSRPGVPVGRWSGRAATATARTVAAGTDPSGLT